MHGEIVKKKNVRFVVIHYKSLVCSKRKCTFSAWEDPPLSLSFCLTRKWPRGFEFHLQIWEKEFKFKVTITHSRT